MKTLRQLFIYELAEMYDAEKQLVRMLPKMALAAPSKMLQKAMQFCLKETESNADKLLKVFQFFDEKAARKDCEAMAGFLEEAHEIARESRALPAITAALMSATIQKIEHYKIASYGCLRDWAALLGNDAAANFLQAMLDDEILVDQALAELTHSERTNTNLADVSTRENLFSLSSVLSHRERAVLRWLAEGLAVGEIARRFPDLHSPVTELRHKKTGGTRKLLLMPPSSNAQNAVSELDSGCWTTTSSAAGVPKPNVSPQR